MRTARLLVPALLSLVLPLTACSPSPGGGDSGAGKTRVTVWSWRFEDKTTYEDIFKTFEKANPDITVEFKPYKNTEYDTILRTGMSGQDGPDVAQLRAYGEFQYLVDGGSLEPLDDKVPALSSWPKAVLDGARGQKDGKVYGVPFAVQTLHVFYNKDIFAKQGLQPPTTWQQMIDAAQKLKQAGIIPFATTVKDTWMLPIDRDIFGAARYGGAQFADKVWSGKANFTDPGYVASIDQLKSLMPYFPPNASGVAYQDAQTLFASGKAAMFPGGIWELATWQQTPNLNVGIFSVPPAPGSATNTTLTPGYVDGSFGVNSHSAHKAAAEKLVAWMATPEFGRLVAEKLKQLSPVPGVEPSDPILAQALKAYQQHPASYLTYVSFGYGTPSGRELESDHLQKVLLGQETAQQAAAAVQQGISQWLKPTG